MQWARRNQQFSVQWVEPVVFITLFCFSWWFDNAEIVLTDAARTT